MQQHRGMGNVLFLCVIFGLILVIGWGLMQQKDSEDLIVKDPNKFTENIIQSQLTAKRTRAMAEYNVGLIYALGRVPMMAAELRAEDPSVCKDGTVNMDNAELADGIRHIHQAPDGTFDGDAVLTAPQADVRCYAQGNAAAVSAFMYDEEGRLISVCMDTASEDSYFYSIASPAAFRCVEHGMPPR